MTPQKIAAKIMEFLDEEVKDISKEDYLEVLEIIDSDIYGRIDCVKEEIGDNEVD